MASEGFDYNYAKLLMNKIKKLYFPLFTAQFFNEYQMVIQFNNFMVTLDYDESLRIHRRYVLLTGLDLDHVYDDFNASI